MENTKPWFKHLKEESKIGSFIFIGIFILFFVLLSIRETNFFVGTYTIKIKFDFAEGLRAASPVRFCGADVGEIKKVEIINQEPRPIVLVTAKIQDTVKIPQNSYFFVNSLSIFGEKYLEITPPDKTNGAYLKNDDSLEGLSSHSIFSIFATFDMTMKDINDFLKDGKMKKSLETTMTNLEKASTDIKDLTLGMKDKQGTIGKLIYDDRLYSYMEEFMADIKSHPWKLLYMPDEGKKK
jgi:phospholipid/cholesterol/gamma-HCH transport system substrate-binding protein